MSVSEDVEEEITKCPYCLKDVISYWTSNGCISKPKEYTLVADWIYHSVCWDEQMERFPPDGKHNPN